MKLQLHPIDESPDTTLYPDNTYYLSSTIPTSEFERIALQDLREMVDEAG